MARENKTLFVRNISYNVSKEALEDKFSDYGPIKQCFLVNNKDTGKSRGFGYIQFTVLEDAKKAKQSSVSIDGRRLIVDYADATKKKRPEKRRRQPEDKNAASNDADKPEVVEKKMKVEEDSEGAESSDDEEMVADVGVVQKQIQHGAHIKHEHTELKGPKLKYHNAKMVQWSGLPPGIDEAELTKILDKMNLKHLGEWKMQGSSGVLLKFKCIRDAKRAIRKLHNHTYKDCMFQAVQMSQNAPVRQQQPAAQNSKELRSRLIVRNLSFKCNEETLQKAFTSCGDVVEASIPSNSDGKMLGFGFVRFATLEEASKAVNEMNSKKILGRPVAVDWALPKGRYESSIQNTKDADSDADSDEGSFSAESDEEPKQTPKSQKKAGKMVKAGKRKQESDSSDDEGVASADDESDDDDEEEQESDGSGSDESQGSDGSDDDDDDFGDEKKKTSKKLAGGPSDTDEGCTLFIRNLSFDTFEEGLQEYFEQYGKLKYAKVVMNPSTEHSKGMGFVKYADKSSAEHCLREAEAGNITLDGRELNVTVAVSREKAAGLMQKETKEKKDNRNLYLAREGMIRPGTQGAEGLAQADLDKRMKMESAKRTKLKNLNIFISPLRLSIHNIPATIDDPELKQVFQKAAQDPKAVINECRIMRDRTRVKGEGKGKSQGFAFVAFDDHQHALAALRHTNNNPDIFGEKKRLIVEFSLENRKALEIQERRKERYQAKKELKASMKEGVQQATGKGGHQGAKKGPPKRLVKQTKPPQLPLIKLSEKDKKMKGPNAPKGLPSHWGPKVRHNTRPSQMQNKKKNKGDRNQTHQKGGKRQAESYSEGPAMKKQKQGRKNEFDSFDKMVNKYKKSFLNKKQAGNKWFE